MEQRFGCLVWRAAVEGSGELSEAGAVSSHPHEEGELEHRQQRRGGELSQCVRRRRRAVVG